MKTEKYSSLYSNTYSLLPGTTGGGGAGGGIISLKSWDIVLTISDSDPVRRKQTLLRKWIKKSALCHLAFPSCAIKLGGNSLKWKTKRRTLLKLNLAE